MCSGGDCKDEFSCRAFGLDYDRPTDFGLSQFGRKSLVYVLYRWIVGLFFLVSFFYGFGSYPVDPWWKWLIFFTHWGFGILTITSLLGAVVALHVYMRVEDDGFDKNNYTMPLGYRVYWFFNNINLGAAPTISIMYWFTVFDPDIHELNYASLTFHIVNSSWTLIDFFFSAVPVRILHVFHGVCFGVVYTLFTVAYWQAGGTDERGNPYIYSIIDYEQDPNKAVIYVFIIYGFVIVLQIIWFGLYKLRLALYRCCGCTQDSYLDPTNRVNHPI